MQCTHSICPTFPRALWDQGILQEQEKENFSSCHPHLFWCWALTVTANSQPQTSATATHFYYPYQFKATDAMKYWGYFLYSHCRRAQQCELRSQVSGESYFIKFSYRETGETDGLNYFMDVHLGWRCVKLIPSWKINIRTLKYTLEFYKTMSHLPISCSWTNMKIKVTACTAESLTQWHPENQKVN